MGWFGPDRRYIIPVNVRYLTRGSKQILLESLDVLTNQYKQIVNLILEFERALAKREFRGQKFRTPLTKDRINYEEVYKVQEYMITEIKKITEKIEAIIKALLPSIATREMSETKKRLEAIEAKKQSDKVQREREMLERGMERFSGEIERNQGKKPGLGGLGQFGFGKA